VPDLPVGRTLQNKYRIERKLGGGGMGDVYLVSQTQKGGGPSRAAKRLYAQAANEAEAKENLELFKAEAEFLAQLSHTAIPMIYERFAEDGDFFMIMELVEGKNLDELRLAAPDNRIPSSLCAHVVAELTAVLGYCHRQRPAPVVYRDLKPQNIMLTPSNRVVLIDFGIARRGSHDIQGTSDRPFFTTEEYCAPEARRLRRTTPRSDIFALGVTVSELLTGRPPEEIRDDPGTIRRACESIPIAGYEWLPDLLMSCCEPNPERRPAHGDAVLEAVSAQRAPKASGRSKCSECGSPIPSEVLFCSRCGHPLVRSGGAASGATITAASMRVPLTYDKKGAVKLLERATSGRPPDDPRWVNLAVRARALDVTVDYSELKSAQRLRFAPLPHQMEAVRTTLRDLRGRALLADEVGLGKTIEALMVIDELRLRGLLKRALILTPSTLVHQWIDEIVDKFEIPRSEILELSSGDDVKRMKRQLIAIGSYEVLKVGSHRTTLQNASFDLVVVDEVQNVISHAKSKDAPHPTKAYELVAGISKKYILLLSATPIQNTIVDLYEIVNLLRPGQLLDWQRFRQTFISHYEVRKDSRRFPIIRNGFELRRLLSEVVVRNTRDRVLASGRFPRRTALRVKVELDQEERDLYGKLRDRLASGWAGGVPPVREMELAEALSSSPAAFVERARGGVWRVDLSDIVSQAKALGCRSTKVQEVLRIVEAHLLKGDRKAIVFSRFPASRELIGAALKRRFQTLVYHKGISNAERVSLLRSFQRSGDVLVVDDSAAVGLNLQFCDLLVNFDLPWNPFLVEQRIGRVQRIGQKSDEVVIANLQVKDTIDEIKLDVCEHKLRMFEGVFGSAPTVLGALQETPVEELFQRMYLERNIARLERMKKDLAQKIESSETELRGEEALNEEVFDKIGWTT